MCIIFYSFFIVILLLIYIRNFEGISYRFWSCSAYKLESLYFFFNELFIFDGITLTRINLTIFILFHNSHLIIINYSIRNEIYHDHEELYRIKSVLSRGRVLKRRAQINGGRKWSVLYFFSPSFSLVASSGNGLPESRQKVGKKC